MLHLDTLYYFYRTPIDGVDIVPSVRPAFVHTNFRRAVS